MLAPSRGGSDGTVSLNNCTPTQVGVAGDYASFTLNISGSNFGAKSVTNLSATVSFNTSSADWIGDVISSDPQVQKSGTADAPAYLFKTFKYAASSVSYGTQTTASIASGSSATTSFSGNAYSSAATP